MVPAVCPLIAKLPQRKRSGDSAEDRKLLKERNALQEIIQLAWDHPSHRHSFLADMKLDLETEASASANMHSDIMFRTALPILGQVDVEWAASSTHC